MKKALFVAVIAVGSMFANADVESKIVNVYDVKLQMKVPYLNNGIRSYKTQAFKGLLKMTYSDGAFEFAEMDITNKTTKVAHHLDFAEQFYNLLGKSTKTDYRSVPTVWLISTNDIVTAGSHETFVRIALAGNGKLKSTRAVTVGCSECGISTRLTSYCSTMKSISGNVTGVMNCECPDDETWDHTLIGTACGAAAGDDVTEIRSHEASTWGTWKAKIDNKLSYTEEVEND